RDLMRSKYALCETCPRQLRFGECPIALRPSHCYNNSGSQSCYVEPAHSGRHVGKQCAKSRSCYRWSYILGQWIRNEAFFQLPQRFCGNLVILENFLGFPVAYTRSPSTGGAFLIVP